MSSKPKRLSLAGTAAIPFLTLWVGSVRESCSEFRIPKIVLSGNNLFLFCKRPRKDLKFEDTELRNTCVFFRHTKMMPFPIPPFFLTNFDMPADRLRKLLGSIIFWKGTPTLHMARERRFSEAKIEVWLIHRQGDPEEISHQIWYDLVDLINLGGLAYWDCIDWSPPPPNRMRPTPSVVVGSSIILIQ